MGLYSYGFNGMEKDDEVKGSGNSYDYGARMYDPRLGKWLSIDALTARYTAWSPYSYALNSPIKLVDANGDVVMDGDKKVIITIDEESGAVSFKLEDGSDVSKDFMKNGGKMILALGQNEYGRSLVKVLNESELEFSIVIKKDVGGNNGKPVKTDKGYTLNFKKYNEIDNAGTRYDYASEDEYYGGILAHDVIDAATPEGQEVNEKKLSDWDDENSEFRKSYDKWQSAKGDDKEKAKSEFIQVLIDNYEQIGMDAELKFRDGLENNSLDKPIGELDLHKAQSGSNPNIKGKTARDVYTNGVK